MYKVDTRWLVGYRLVRNILTHELRNMIQRYNTDAIDMSIKLTSPGHCLIEHQELHGNNHPAAVSEQTHYLGLGNNLEHGGNDVLDPENIGSQQMRYVLKTISTPKNGKSWMSLITPINQQDWWKPTHTRLEQAGAYQADWRQPCLHKQSPRLILLPA